MISLDQVLLLEEKVESAVAKIQQLEAENDALRNKCSELTNALSAKTEQLVAYESEQNKIESGIIKAIDRLNSIENSVLKAAGQSAPKEAHSAGLAATAAKVAAATTVAAVTQQQPAPTQVQEEKEVVEEPDVIDEPVEEAQLENSISEEETTEEPITEETQPAMNFDSMETVSEEPAFEEEIPEDSEEEPEATDELGFDIF